MSNHIKGQMQRLASDGITMETLQNGRSLQSVQAKTVRVEENCQDLREQLYEVQWTATQLPALLEQPGEASARTWLLLIDHQGIGEHLQSMLTLRGQHSVCVTRGSQFCQLAEASYQVDITDPQWATSLLRIEQEQGAYTFTDVLHLWSLDTTPTQEMDEQTLLHDQTLSAGSALTVMQALIASAREPFPRCWLVTRGAQPVGEDQTQLAVVQAPLWGLGKTFAMEHPELWGGLLDLDAHETSAASAAHLLQWTQRECKEDQVAFRHGRAYAARLVRTSMPPLDTEPLVVHPDASYLITGGLQGVGLLMAHWFVEHGARYLVLIGRTQLPPRSQWHHLKPGDPLGAKIAAIRELEALGAQVQYAAVDVSNRVQLTALLTTLPMLGYPALRGVVHAASVWQDHEGRPLVRPLSNLTATAMADVFRPKVLGSWLLSTLLQETPLDFFVSFSSGASLVGSATQGNYAAAGEFLDVWASYQRAHGQPALSIDWGAIADVGFGVTAEGQRVHRYWETRGIQRLTPAQVQTAFAHLLPPQRARIGVMKLDWELLAHSFPHLVTQPLFRNLVEAHTQRRSISASPAGVIRSSMRHRLSELASGEQLQVIEDYLRVQVAQLLGHEVGPSDLQRSMISMGLDSLIALELKQRLEAEFTIHISITTFLRGPSIAQFAGELQQILMEPKPLTPTPQREGSPVHESLTESTTAQQHERQGKIDALRIQLGHLSKAQIMALLEQQPMSRPVREQQYAN